MKKIMSLLLAVVMILSLAACSSAPAETEPATDPATDPATTEAPSADPTENTDPVITTGEIGVVEDTKLEAFYIQLTPAEFEALGFSLGDSVDIAFDNGFTLTDLPYYNGFYALTGSPLLVAYPGADLVAVCRAQGHSIFKEANANENSKITVTMNEKGKYLTVQETFSMKYSNERADFDSDVVFANFRVLVGGNLKENLFYRSASPCNNLYSRAKYVNDLCEEAGIKYIIDLADNEEDVQGYLAEEGFQSEYYKTLYDNGKVSLLDLSNNYRTEKFATAIANALLTACEVDGPYLIQCNEGKDRTGFACMLVLALSGATADEMIDDYMITYANYYGITKEDTPEKYAAVVEVKAKDSLYYFAGLEPGADLSNADFVSGAEDYLRLGGLTDEQIAAIKTAITK